MLPPPSSYPEVLSKSKRWKPFVTWGPSRRMQNGSEGAVWSAADIDLFLCWSLEALEAPQPTHGYNGDSRTSAVKEKAELHLYFQIRTNLYLRLCTLIRWLVS
jgi:hypothetical protein